MTMQFSETLRNARVDAIGNHVGESAVLKFRSGTQPASVATADSGTVLALMSLPTSWLNTASGGAGTKAGTWEDLSADSTGYAGHWRIYASDGTTPHLQGPCAEAWADSTYVAGQRVLANGNVYVCTTGGTSTVAPSGTGAGQSPGGSSVWDYVQPGTGVMLLGSTSLVAAQTVTVQTFTITDGNA